MTPRRAALLQRLKEGAPILMDGPTGTELERAGVDTTGPLWSGVAVRQHRDLLERVHRRYVEAGAEVHTAVTFRLDRAAAARAGVWDEDWRALVKEAVEVARNSAQGGAQVRSSRPQWVAGSMAPIGDCYAPEEVPADAVLEDAHHAMAVALADAGVDLVVIETMNTTREAVAATRAALASDLLPWTSFVVLRGGLLLSGEPLQEAVREVVAAGAACVLVNCASLDATRDALVVLQRAGVPWGIFPNGSRGQPQKGWTAGEEVTDEDIVALASEAIALGARVVGSCCGTTPATIARLRTALDAVNVGTA